jgi:hypothetical protein
MPPEEEIDSSAVDSSADVSAVDTGSSAVESPQQSAPAAPQYGVPELWGAFKSLPQFQGQDDRSVAAGLYEALQREQASARALQQYQQIIPFASEYLQYREPFEQWRKSQSQPQAPQQAMPQPQESPWWDPPKLKDSYRQWLTKDENGREIIDPNAPLDARAALSEHMSYKADFAKKFLENPESTLGPMVEKVAVQRAEQIVQDKIQRMRDEDFVTGLERENKDWLYSQDGNVSPEGLAVQKYIQDARSLGVGGAKARWDYATKMVERDLMLANLQQQHQQLQYRQAQQVQPQAAPMAPVDDSAQRNMEYLRQQAMRQASQRPTATTDARVPSKPMTFSEKLAANLKHEGLI